MSDHHVWLIGAGNVPSDSDGETTDEERKVPRDEHEIKPLAECRVSILNMSITKSNHFFHDSGANRHIAHDRGIFTKYMPIKPISVSAFGDKLATHAIGIGSTYCISQPQGRT